MTDGRGMPAYIVGNPKIQKKILLAFFEYILASMLKVFLNM